MATKARAAMRVMEYLDDPDTKRPKINDKLRDQLKLSQHGEPDIA
jgi:hypothetical protein